MRSFFVNPAPSARVACSLAQIARRGLFSPTAVSRAASLAARVDSRRRRVLRFVSFAHRVRLRPTLDSNPASNAKRERLRLHPVPTLVSRVCPEAMRRLPVKRSVIFARLERLNRKALRTSASNARRVTSQVAQASNHVSRVLLERFNRYRGLPSVKIVLRTRFKISPGKLNVCYVHRAKHRRLAAACAHWQTAWTLTWMDSDSSVVRHARVGRRSTAMILMIRPIQGLPKSATI